MSPTESHRVLAAHGKLGKIRQPAVTLRELQTHRRQSRRPASRCRASRSPSGPGRPYMRVLPDPFLDRGLDLQASPGGFGHQVNQQRGKILAAHGVVNIHVSQCVSGHRVVVGVARILRHGDAATMPDGPQAGSAIVEHAGQHHADDVAALFVGS